jgi:hypothetical protein
VLPRRRRVRGGRVRGGDGRRGGGRAPERPSAATVSLRGGPLPDWPAAGRSCFLVLYAATGAPLAKYWLAKARPTAATVLTCDYIQEMAP